MLVQVAYALLIGDLIMMVANQCRPYEIVPGSTDKAIDICMDAVIKRFTGERMVRYGEVKHLFRFVLAVFGKLKLDKTQKKSWSASSVRSTSSSRRSATTVWKNSCSARAASRCCPV